MVIWKIILKIIQILNSEETPNQVALGFALGSVIALTPFFSPHNLLVLLIIMITQVSFRSAVLGFTLLFIPSYAMSPIANGIGLSLLTETPGMVPFWRSFFDLPLMGFSRLNNSYTLGSLVLSLILFIPIFIGVRYFVFRYRKDLKDKIIATKWFKALSATKIFIWVKKGYDILGKGVYE
jgi:uncharacterized protein (TIGR03546 family)